MSTCKQPSLAKFQCFAFQPPQSVFAHNVAIKLGEKEKAKPYEQNTFKLTTLISKHICSSIRKTFVKIDNNMDNSDRVHTASLVD